MSKNTSRVSAEYEHEKHMSEFKVMLVKLDAEVDMFIWMLYSLFLQQV